jgi:hypothetical protein
MFDFKREILFIYLCNFYKKNKRRRLIYIHPFLQPPPSHSTEGIIPLEKGKQIFKKPNLPSLKNNQTSPSHATQ